VIIEVEGDITKTKADAIVHGVAPNDNFHQGLALTLRERWPALYKDFRHYCQSVHPKSGDLWAWKGAGGPVILNLFTQEGSYGHQDNTPKGASLSHVNHSLKALKKEVGALGLKSVAVTRLATGVGGLKWEDVKPLIDRHLGELEIPVYVYVKYHKDLQANEK
jgi:O-acetyl-ADP-ribose deacetylase (regulator of RNase III)